jgi:hypothetical protein
MKATHCSCFEASFANVPVRAIGIAAGEVSPLRLKVDWIAARNIEPSKEKRDARF